LKRNQIESDGQLSWVYPHHQIQRFSFWYCLCYQGWENTYGLFHF